MKHFTQLLLASVLAFAAATLSTSTAEARRRRPVLQYHHQHGNWHRTSNEHRGGPRRAKRVPELDPASGASALVLLGALAMLACGRREETLVLTD